MKTLLAILLNVMGIVIYFLTRFKSRRDQDKTFSLKYWINDNWVEVLITVLFDAALVLLVMVGDIQLNIAQFLPEWVTSSGGLTLSFLLGLGLSAGIYEIIKTKMK